MRREHAEETSIWPPQKEAQSKIHLAVDEHGMAVRMVVIAGTVADCSQPCRLREGINAQNLLADKGYDSNAIVDSLAGSKIPLSPLFVNAAKYHGIITSISTAFGIWWRIPIWN